MNAIMKASVVAAIATVHSKRRIGTYLTSKSSLQAYVRYLLGISANDLKDEVVLEEEPDIAPSDAPVVLSPASFTVGLRLLEAGPGNRSILYQRVVKINEAVDPLDWVVMRVTYTTGRYPGSLTNYDRTISGTGAQFTAGVDIPDFLWVNNPGYGENHMAQRGGWAPDYMGTGTQWSDHVRWASYMPGISLLKDVKIESARVFRGVF